MYIFISWRLWHCSWFPCTSLCLLSKERVLLPCAQCLGGSRVLSLVLFLSHSAHSPRGAPSIPVVSRPSAWWWLQSHLPVQTFLALPDTWECYIGWSMCISDSALAKPVLGCPLLLHPVPIHSVTWDMKATLCLHAFLVCISLHEIGVEEETRGVDLHTLSVFTWLLCVHAILHSFGFFFLVPSLLLWLLACFSAQVLPSINSSTLGLPSPPPPPLPSAEDFAEVSALLWTLLGPQGELTSSQSGPTQPRVASSHVISGSLLCLCFCLPPPVPEAHPESRDCVSSSLYIQHLAQCLEKSLLSESAYWMRGWRGAFVPNTVGVLPVFCWLVFLTQRCM